VGISLAMRKNTMKCFLCTFTLLVLSVSAFAQNVIVPPRYSENSLAFKAQKGIILKVAPTESRKEMDSRLMQLLDQKSDRQQTIQGMKSLSEHGGSSDGGGVSCKVPEVNQGQPIILDLAVYRTDVSDFSTPGAKIEISKTAADKGFDVWEAKTNPSVQYALERVRDWSQQQGSSGVMEQLGNNIAYAMRYVVTPFNISKLVRVYLPPESLCQMSDLSTVALYKNGIVNISIPKWNELGVYSQAAIIIHEGLRHLQITQGLESSDEDLERTTTIILSAYDGATHLDELPFFKKFAQRQKALRERVCTAIHYLDKTYAHWKVLGHEESITELCSERSPFDNMKSYFWKTSKAVQDLQEAHANAFKIQEKLDITIAIIQVVDLNTALLGAPVETKASGDLKALLDIKGLENAASKEKYRQYLQD
jgi:hypothetical protein